MIDNEHDEINLSRLFTYLVIGAGTCYVWYSIFTAGFFITIIWLIIISAIIGICIKMWDMRL